jgi:hypothetical protein
MKGLLSATLVASLLGCAGAFAQSASTDGAQQTAINKIAGKKFYSADGASLTIVAFKGGLAREIHEPDGSTEIQTFALTGGKTGTVSDAEGGSKAAGSFQLTQAGLTTEYSDGRSEIFAPNSAGGMSMELREPAGDRICTAWYPEGHRFSDAERKAALIDISDRLDLDVPHSSANHGCDPVSTREAGTHAHRRVAQSSAATSHSDESVVARLPE